MSQIKIHKVDEAHVAITTEDSGILYEISDHYTFYVPGYQFVPSFKNKLWDGKIRLFDRRTQYLPAGLLSNLVRFCESRGYECLIDRELNFIPPTESEVLDFMKTLNLPFEPRDYQIEAVKEGLQHRRRILISPTGSQKAKHTIS